MAIAQIHQWLNNNGSFEHGLQLYKNYCLNPDKAFLSFVSGEPTAVKRKMLFKRLQELNEKPLTEKPQEFKGHKAEKPSKNPPKLVEVAAWQQKEHAVEKREEISLPDAPPELQAIIKTKNNLWRQMVADREACLHTHDKAMRARYLDRIKENYKLHQTCWMDIEHYQKTGYVRGFTQNLIPKRLKSFETLQELLNTLKNYENYVFKHTKNGNTEKADHYKAQIKALHDNYNAL